MKSPILHILCLHDADSDAIQLQEWLDLLGQRLYERHQIELVYINSPLVVTASKSITSAGIATKSDKSVTKDARCETTALMDRHSPANQASSEQSQPKANDSMNDDNMHHRNGRVWWWNNPAETNLISNKQHESKSSTIVKSHGRYDASIDPIVNNTKIMPLEIRHDPVSQQDQSQPEYAQLQYCGLDASLLLLQQVWSSRPFWGILGVGQGAAIAAMFTLMLTTGVTTITSNNDSNNNNKNHVIPPPQVAIFIHAAESLLREEEQLVENTIPCLHVMDTIANRMQQQQQQQNHHHHQQPVSPHAAQQRLLLKQLGGVVIECTSSFQDEKSVALGTAEMNGIGRFLVNQKLQQQQRQRCRRKSNFHAAAAAAAGNDNDDTATATSAGKITELHKALYEAELEVTRALLTEITIHPPASLMAVIGPQAVAGWKGKKPTTSRQEQQQQSVVQKELGNNAGPVLQHEFANTTPIFNDDQGGGAPCPAEFLLPMKERVHNSQR